VPNAFVCKQKLTLTGSESQGQEEAACTHPAYVTTSVLFSGTNAMKFASLVTCCLEQ